MKRLGLFFLLVLSLASRAAAADQNLCFKKICLTEMTYEEYKDAYWRGATCDDESNPLGDQYCYSHPPNETIAGVKVESVLARFYERRLHFLYITFSSGSFETVAKTMVERYGKPTETETLTFQNAMGATFKGRAYSWNSTSGQRVRLKQYAGKLDESSVTYTSKYFHEESWRRMEADKKKNANDL